jgi:hypothetical protein
MIDIKKCNTEEIIRLLRLSHRYPSLGYKFYEQDDVSGEIIQTQCDGYIVFIDGRVCPIHLNGSFVLKDLVIDVNHNIIAVPHSPICEVSFHENGNKQMSKSYSKLNLGIIKWNNVCIREYERSIKGITSGNSIDDDFNASVFTKSLRELIIDGDVITYRDDKIG